MRVFQLKAEYCYGADGEEKKAKQRATLEALGAVEDVDGKVYCDASMALQLFMSGYCGTGYVNADAIVEVKLNQDKASVEDIRRSAEPSGYSEAFNHRCKAEQPTPWLHQVVRTMLLEDACTDELQRRIAEGWRILSIQPQPDKRRPDYILGRNDAELPTEAARPRS
jgi:hypothetical protein